MSTILEYKRIMQESLKEAETKLAETEANLKAVYDLFVSEAEEFVNVQVVKHARETLLKSKVIHLSDSQIRELRNEVFKLAEQQREEARTTNYRTNFGNTYDDLRTLVYCYEELFRRFGITTGKPDVKLTSSMENKIHEFNSLRHQIENEGNTIETLKNEISKQRVADLWPED